MSKQANNLKMGLLDNGSHSLKRGYEVWNQWNKSEDGWLLKESVIWVHHGIELLLKQLLVQTNEFLVFQDVNKAVERLGILRKKDGMKNAGVLDLFEYDDKVISVGFRKLIDRAAITLSIDELSEREPLRKKIDQLTRYRNKIVHFSIELDVVEVSSLLSEILVPLLSLLSKEVDDQDFKKKVIPEIYKLAQPVQKYIEYVRGEIVDSAINATKKALPPTGNGRAGIVSQALGSGLNRSLISYVKAVKRLVGDSETPIMILADRRMIADQLYDIISRENDIMPLFPDSKTELISLIESKNPKIIISTVQKIASNCIKSSKRCLLIGYNLRSIPEKIVSSLPSATYILFTHMPSQLALDFFGQVVGEYNLRQAIHDGISTPIRVEKIELMTLNNGTQELSSLAGKIIQHFELRQTKWLGKAFVVVHDIETANVLLRHIERIRPKWHNDFDSSTSVCTISSTDRNERINSLFDRFRDRDSSLSLLIGTGIFLTGFDNLLLNTVYVTYPISRQLQYKLAGLVSRDHKDKQDGLIVDFTGLNWWLG